MDQDLQAMSRPVFVIGSPRSGTSILTWSLGQHPNLYPLEETVWFGPFGRAAEKAFEIGSSRGEFSQLSGMGVTEERFMRGLGAAIDTLILEHRSWPEHDVAEDNPFARARRTGDPKQRWVDGTPENSHCVSQLTALFPEARFIHLLRDPAAVVRSLGNFDRVGGEPRQADDACRQWLRHVKACLDAERSLPPETVMRLAHADLDSSPEPSLRRCLEFLGEPWSADCLKPLGHRINSSAPRDPEATIHVDANLLAEARSICAEAGLDPPDSMVGREDSEAACWR
jgi:hypothetical protein